MQLNDNKNARRNLSGNVSDNNMKPSDTAQCGEKLTVKLSFPANKIHVRLNDEGWIHLDPRLHAA